MSSSACLCGTLRDLATRFDEPTARSITSDLNKHLETIRIVLSKAKPLARDVRYQVIPNNQRTEKILSVKSVDSASLKHVHERFRNDIQGFWESPPDPTLTELRRRFSCIVVFLRWTLDAQAVIPPSIAHFVRGQKIPELRYAGKKYIKMARKLGGVGKVLWLPLDVASSTYERYLSMDDEATFNHLKSLCAGAQVYNSFVQRIISSQLNDNSLGMAYYNLFAEYGDVLPNADRLLLLLHILGGSKIPDLVLKSVRSPQICWGEDGEMKSVSAAESDLPQELTQLLSDENDLSEALARPEITKHVLEDGTLTWSISPQFADSFSNTLAPQAEENLVSIALRLVCFAVPPPYEGKTAWSQHLKKAVWDLLDKATTQKKISQPDKLRVIEALLYLCERDSVTVRRPAVQRARALLTKSMPYYFHASVVLFESILYRLDGLLAKSETKIRDFLDQTQNPVTRLDNAIRGRLHISLLENKVQNYDEDVASCMYAWEGTYPLSTLEIEVTRRLQGLAAKFFQSIGDFNAARASLEQHLWLNTAKPIRRNTHLLIVGKLADVYCELHEYDKAIDILAPDISTMPETEKKGRPFRRLLLASVEANLGKVKLDDAELVLQRLVEAEPAALDDINDQFLHMRRLILSARTAHHGQDYVAALQRWRFALQTMEQLTIFRPRHRCEEAIIYLSLAHAQLKLGDDGGGRQSWATGVDILRTERCEYVVPVFATTWLHEIVSAIHESQGWPFRMMLPGRKPDMTWP